MKRDREPYGTLCQGRLVCAVLFVVLSLAQPCVLHAQQRNIAFEHFMTDDGLSSNDITSLLHDSRGFMWFGTASGLNKFTHTDQYKTCTEYWYIKREKMTFSSNLLSKTQMSTPKTVGYLRVSTTEQDLEKNKAAILTLANDENLGKVHFVEERASDKISWRRRTIATVLEELHEGDTLLVSELSRLGRSMLECMEILSIATQKGINVYAIKGTWRLDGTLQSKIVAMAFSMAAEIERDLISSRTKEALRAKKAAGIKLGRPKGPGKSKLDPYRPEIEALLANGSRQKFIAERYGTTESNLSNYLKKRGLRRAGLSA